MILIAHRGNICGRVLDKENTIAYINKALKENFYVEIDIRYYNGRWFLGHDIPQEEVDHTFLNNEKFFVHAKNTEALQQLNMLNLNCEYFWHNTDDYTLTSRQTIWVYPGKQLITNSICVMPELGYTGNISVCKGVCSDNITAY